MLIAYLFVAGQRKEFLLKNHQSLHSRFVSLLEANAISIFNHRQGHGCGRGHGHYYGQGRGQGCGRNYDRYHLRNHDSHDSPQNKKNDSHNQKLKHLETSSEKATKSHNKRNYETEC